MGYSFFWRNKVKENIFRPLGLDVKAIIKSYVRFKDYSKEK